VKESSDVFGRGQDGTGLREFSRTRPRNTSTGKVFFGIEWVITLLAVETSRSVQRTARRAWFKSGWHSLGERVGEMMGEKKFGLPLIYNDTNGSFE
jgi:hypothetical protein